MDGTDTRRLEIGLQPQIEIRCIDPDEDIRPQFKQAPLQLATNTGNLPVMLQRIPIAHDRQFFHRPPGIEALALHLRPTDTVEHGIRQMLLQRRNQMAGQEIPGGLSCHHGNTNSLAHVSE